MIARRRKEWKIINWATRLRWATQCSFMQLNELQLHLEFFGVCEQCRLLWKRSSFFRAEILIFVFLVLKLEVRQMRRSQWIDVRLRCRIENGLTMCVYSTTEGSLFRFRQTNDECDGNSFQMVNRSRIILLKLLLIKCEEPIRFPLTNRQF